MKNFILFLLGHRTAPLIMTTNGPGGSNKKGLLDFFKYLIGERGYLKIQ